MLSKKLRRLYRTSLVQFLELDFTNIISLSSGKSKGSIQTISFLFNQFCDNIGHHESKQRVRVRKNVYIFRKNIKIMWKRRINQITSRHILWRFPIICDLEFYQKSKDCALLSSKAMQKIKKIFKGQKLKMDTKSLNAELRSF